MNLSMYWRVLKSVLIFTVVWFGPVCACIIVWYMHIKQFNRGTIFIQSIMISNKDIHCQIPDMYSIAVRWIRVGKPQFWRSKKNSNSTQFVELYFGVSEQKKPLQPIGQAAEFKFESKFEPLPTSAGHLAITPEGYSRRQSKDLTAKSMAKLLGPRSCTAWAGLTGEYKHSAFPSRRQSLLAATDSLEENMLPLLQYLLSSTVKKV